MKVQGAERFGKPLHYMTFHVITAGEAAAQIKNAEAVLHQIETFLIPIYEKNEKETTT